MTVTTNKIQGMRLIIKGFSLMGVKVQNQNGNRPTDIDLKNPDKIPEEIIIQNRNRAGKASIEQMKKISAKLVKKKIMLDGRFYSLFDHS